MKIRIVRFAVLVAAALSASLALAESPSALPATLLVVPDASASPRAGAGTAIARIWRGRTVPAKADAYEEYLNASGITKILATPGNLGVTLLRRAEKTQTEFVVVSYWESIEAVQRFAGKDYRKAVILPRDREYLISVEPTVLHYEVVRDEKSPR